MFNFKRKTKITQSFICIDPHIEIQIHILDKIGINFGDNEYMCYLRTPYYHSFGKISDKQFNEFQTDFNFSIGTFKKGTIPLDQFIQHDFPIHKNYESAKDSNYRINLAIPYIYYCPANKIANLSSEESKKYLNISLMDNIALYEKEISTVGSESLISLDSVRNQVKTQFYSLRGLLSIKTILEAIQSNQILELIYNDYDETIFNHKKKISYKSSAIFVFIKDTFNPEISNVRSFSELVKIIVGENSVSKGFKSELAAYLIQNCIDELSEPGKVTLYALNQNLINQLILISKYIDFSKRTVSDLKKIITKFKSNDYCFHETMFFDMKNNISENYYLAFNKHLLFLKKQGFDLYDVLLNWNVYFSTMIGYASLLDEVTFSLDPSRFKDLNRTYNYIGKRLSENLDNFYFENVNGDGFNNDLEVLESISIDLYKIHVVKDFNELFSLGMQLDNCAGSKASISYYQGKINYVITNGSKRFLGGISKGQIHQLKGFKNESPPIELFSELFLKLESLNFIAPIENQKIQKRYKKRLGQNILALYEQECVQHN